MFSGRCLRETVEAAATSAVRQRERGSPRPFCILDTAEKLQIPVTAVAQGSKLGPDLWNVMNNGIFELEIPDDPMAPAFLEAYVDDVIAVIATRNMDAAQWKVNRVMRSASG